jgi:hypothetical protein
MGELLLFEHTASFKSDSPKDAKENEAEKAS